MSDSITFKFTLTEEDFVQASHVHAFSQKRWWITWAVFFGLWIVPLAAVLLDKGLAGDALYRLLPFLAGLASVAVLFMLAWSWQPKRAARGSPYLGVEMEGVASSDGLAMDSPLGKQEAAWASYSTVLESADHFLLYLARNAYAPLPKRAFADQTDIGRFRELVRAHVPNARVLD
ncbi:MAG: YcxB family protein [Alphaproteobacteria bacterium]|nr:YcxB family protein [Alphaproteobacteria bacterium]